MPIRVHLIAGARPNFMKIAPLWWQLSVNPEFDPIIVHTGQHYDANMSGDFFEVFNLPPPHFSLNVGSGSHAVMTAKIMLAYEPICLDGQPDVTVVCGDVNSTVACSLVAAKLGIPVVHLEAGLRSRDRSMPEELNRIVVDHLSDLLWTPSPDGTANLRAEGIDSSKIAEIGNIMIDSLCYILTRTSAEETLRKFGVSDRGFAVATIHRPSNTDDAAMIQRIIRSFERISRDCPILWPIHPRTKNVLQEAGVVLSPHIRVTPPLPYDQFISLVSASRAVITDSGGIQEETSYLGVPCLTLRPNTERPITIELGTNQLVTLDQLEKRISAIDVGAPRQQCRIPLWDGRTAERAVSSLQSFMNSSRAR